MSDLAELVETSARVSATRSRREKIDLISSHLRARDPASVEPSVAFLSGVIPQGALGVGWATIGEIPDSAERPTLGVGDVMDTFDRLVNTNGPGSQSRRRELISDLMGAATADEQGFLRGLITGDIRQGALEGIMVESVARTAGVPAAAVRRATMLNGRIWEVAGIAISGGEASLLRIGLTLFRPVKPMLASSAGDLEEALGRTGPAAVEWKLDGIRIQVHLGAGRVAVYTRNLNDVTERMGELVDLAGALDCESAVLDGEALFVDDEGRPARFQETAGRFSTEALDERGIRPYFFDVLHLDGQDLIDRPLTERRRLLEGVAGDHLVPQVVADSLDNAVGVLQEALGAAHEGVVVKELDSAYEAGRRGSSWIKVKPVHTLDLIVLAAEWGHGRRQGWLSNLHLGARGTDGEPVMVGKTFKGLTDELLRWQTDRLQEIEQRRTRSTVYVRPELVVEIALDGVQTSTRYPGGVALRFARVRGYRPDKDPAEADTITTVRSLAGLPPLEG